MDYVGSKAVDSTSLPIPAASQCALGVTLTFLLLVTATTLLHAEQTYHFADGRQLVGDLLQLTKNNLFIRRERGGVAQFARRDLERIEIATEDGEIVSGRLIRFDDQTFEIEGPDQAWTIRDNVIIAERQELSGVNEPVTAADGDDSNGKGGPVIRIKPTSLGVAIAEKQEDAGVMRFDITLDPAPDQMLALIYTTLGGSAIADEDYVSTQGVISVKPGTTSLSIDVPLIDDDIHEPSERFTLYLATDPTAARIETSRVEGLITDND